MLTRGLVVVLTAIVSVVAGLVLGVSLNQYVEGIERRDPAALLPRAAIRVEDLGNGWLRYRVEDRSFLLHAGDSESVTELIDYDRLRPSHRRGLGSAGAEPE